MFPRCETFRLYGRGEAGVCCDVDGVGLGPLKLIERAEKSYFVRPVGDIIQMLEVAYGPLPGAVAEDLALKIISIARSLNGGNMTQAMLKTLYLRLPEIPAENMAKMGRVAVGKVTPCGKEMTAAKRAARRLEKALNMALDSSQKAVAKVNNNTATECRDEKGRWCVENSGSHVTSAEEAAAKHKVKIKTGVNVKNLDPKMVDTIGVMSSVASDLNLPDVVITSGNDGKHMQGSLHYKNKALDFRGNNITLEQGGIFKDRIQARLGKDYQVFFETFPHNPRNNHIHIEYQPKT